jgi:phage tail-like protein
MARQDPYVNFRFLVELDGIVQAGFSDCSGFGSQVEVVEYREGGDPNTVRKRPGKVTYPDITLKWGVTDSTELVDWHMAAVRNAIVRKNGSIILLADDGTTEVGRWNFFAAWPSKWDGPDFSAKGNEIAINTLTVTCERLEPA